MAALAALSHERQEPLLVQFSQSLTRLIDRVYQTIEDCRVNKFDQIRINSFLQRPGVWDHSIQIYLKPSIYQRYWQVWQRLICFAYRTSRPGQPIVLRHQLTIVQLAALDRIKVSAQRLLHGDGSLSAIQAQLDKAYLAFSIVLLDHSLKGDLFESVLVGFLAALGIDAANQTFHELYGYTGYLSGLVKIAQMLVVEQAVRMADGGDVAHPADILDAMRECFLLHGVRAPFGWITRLRTYRKKVQNTIISQGYIYWSKDKQTLMYKELRLTITGFRRFIRTEMELAQADFEKLFLIHEKEIREDIVSILYLAQLQDDPTKNTRE